jgi:hypothetical protein
MFFLNLGSRWTLSTVEGVTGAIYLAEGNDQVRLSRPVPREFDRLLFDPQLYLQGLDAALCARSCGRLATHPWFGIDGVPQFEEGGSVREWQASVREMIAAAWPAAPPATAELRSARARSAIEFQIGLGCTDILLPCPLIARRENGAAVLAEWLEAGLEAAADLEIAQPLLVTIALSDAILDPTVFEAGGLLDAVADQVTAREGIDGAYIVVAQNAGEHPFETSNAVQRTYAQLTRVLSEHYATVITNFCDVFGIVCVAAGASGFGSGGSYGNRRLSLAGFRDDGFGIALPHFYSHKAAGEFLSERQLDRITERRLLRRVRDTTEYSRSLMDELSRGGTAAGVPQWAESRNNYQEATRHFVSRLAVEGAEVDQGTAAERLDNVEEWLEEADANRVYLQNLLGADIGRFAPTTAWLEILRTVLS